MFKYASPSAREPSPFFAWLISTVLKDLAKSWPPTGSLPRYALPCQAAQAGNARRLEAASAQALAEPKLRKYLLTEKKITFL